MPTVDAAIQQLRSLLQIEPKETDIVYRIREKRTERTDAINSAVDSGVSRFQSMSNSLL